VIRVVIEHAPSGTFCRASQRDERSIVLSPSRATPEAALRELDRDAGGPTTYARERLPGEPTFIPRPGDR
jgi:hypothetical protein